MNRPESGLKVALILRYVPIDLCLEPWMGASTAHEGNRYVWTFSNGLGRKGTKWPGVSCVCSKLSSDGNQIIDQWSTYPIVECRKEGDGLTFRLSFAWCCHGSVIIGKMGFELESALGWEKVTFYMVQCRKMRSINEQVICGGLLSPRTNHMQRAVIPKN